MVHWKANELFVFPVSLKDAAKYKHSSDFPAKHIMPLLLRWWTSAVVQENAGRRGDGSKQLETPKPPLSYMGIQLFEAMKAKNFHPND